MESLLYRLPPEVCQPIKLCMRVPWQGLAILIYAFLLHGLIAHLAVILHLRLKEKRQIESIFQNQQLFILLSTTYSSLLLFIWL